MKTVASAHIGILALQGDFERHRHQLTLLGASPHEVRLPADLHGIDGLIIPGGESTTMSLLIDRYGLREPLREFGQTRPVWGTCAGMILLATEIVDNQAGVEPLKLMDIDVLRTGYGRQVHSAEEIVPADLGNGTQRLAASFIRAPRIARLGESVATLAKYGSDPVLVSEGHLLASSFHTELDDDTRLLRYFLETFVLPRL